MPPCESVGEGSVLFSVVIEMLASTVLAVASVVKNRLVMSVLSCAGWPSLLKLPLMPPRPVGSKNWSPDSSVSSGSPHGVGAAPAGAASARVSAVSRVTGTTGRRARMDAPNAGASGFLRSGEKLARSIKDRVEHRRRELARERVLLTGVKAAEQGPPARLGLGRV